MTQRDRAASLEAYVSVDVETAGPNPSRYSLLSIGACLVADIQRTFYVELQPINGNFTPEALAVSGLSLEELAERGLPPAEAMARFETWLEIQIPSSRRPIFVAFNAPFDWMFINDYVQPADCLSLPGTEPLRLCRLGPEGILHGTDRRPLVGDHDALPRCPLLEQPQTHTPRPPRCAGPGRAVPEDAGGGGSQRIGHTSGAPLRTVTSFIDGQPIQ